MILNMDCLILAKIHMVTKRSTIFYFCDFSLILAKIHMVTKHTIKSLGSMKSLILAKIHMVTKRNSSGRKPL